MPKKKVSMTLPPDLLGKIQELKNSVPLAKFIPDSIWYEAILKIGLKTILERMRRGESLEEILRQYEILI